MEQKNELFEAFITMSKEELQQVSDTVNAYIRAKCNELPTQDTLDAFFDAMKNSNDTG
jgi:hypothetical protein